MVDLFSSLQLVEFSAVTDDGQFVENATMESLSGANYACGLFVFTKLPKPNPEAA